MFPRWFDLHALRVTLAVSVVVLGLGAVLVTALVRRVVVKLVALVVILAAGAGVFVYRSRLDTCERNCDCKVLDSRIHVPGCLDGVGKLPGA